MIYPNPQTKAPCAWTWRMRAPGWHFGLVGGNAEKATVRGVAFPI